MKDDKLNYNDVREYENLFIVAPAFLLETFARKNKNIVSNFKSRILSHLSTLDEEQKNKLDLILRTDVEELQLIMKEAYLKTNLKQYKILANPKYRDFIESNLDELRKII